MAVLILLFPLVSVTLYPSLYIYTCTCPQARTEHQVTFFCHSLSWRWTQQVSSCTGMWQNSEYVRKCGSSVKSAYRPMGKENSTKRHSLGQRTVRYFKCKITWQRIQRRVNKSSSISSVNRAKTGWALCDKHFAFINSLYNYQEKPPI